MNKIINSILGDNVRKIGEAITFLDPNKSIEHKENQLRVIADLVIRTEISSKLQDAQLTLTHILTGSNILIIFADVLEHNMVKWAVADPFWVTKVAYFIVAHSSETDTFSEAQFIRLFQVLVAYIEKGYFGTLSTFSIMSTFRAIQVLLSKEQGLIYILKEHLDNSPVRSLLVSLANTEEGQFILLSDTDFIKKILTIKDFNWKLLSNLSQHSDAKTMLPPEVLVQAIAAKHIDICLLLCNDDHLHLVNLGDKWIRRTVKLLNELLTTGRASKNLWVYHLLDLVLPIANLSVLDSQKEIIGNRAVNLLLKVLIGPLPHSPRYIQLFLTRGTQEAARALWNFAYVESNRQIISKNIQQLRTVLSETKDPVLKKNIEGILYMVSPPKIANNVKVDTGHIMISYNWGDQNTVKEIAKSLEGNGFRVWLDVEKMEGSTLQSMASAIENAEMVLMCFSQKYKDSPNCRLEGEYCVTRRVPFIPLKMQQEYRPDGWLGIALGSKLYYDFSDGSSWDNKMLGLMKAINGIVKAPQPAPTTNTTTKTPDTDIKTNVKAVSAWTLEDVKQWMQSKNIGRHFPLFESHLLDGAALEELKHLCTTQNTLFVQYLQQMGVNEFGEILKISSAIRQL